MRCKGQVQVRQGRVVAVVDMPAGPQAVIALAHDKDGQPVMKMQVAVGDAGSVHDHRTIEHGGVAFSHRLQPGDELGEETDVVGLDPGQLGQRRRIVAMMRQLMMRFGNADLIVTADTRFASEHHGGDPR